MLEEGMDKGRSWINANKDTWSFMEDYEHYMMLQEYGFGRTWTQEYGYQRAGPDQMNMVQMELGQDEIQMELDLRGSEASLNDSLGAYMEAKIAGFKPMADNDSLFTCDEVADWLRTLSRISNCQSLYCCAEEYAHRIVVDEEMIRRVNWLWLRDDKEFWMRFIGMTEEEYEVLERFGFDRGTEMYMYPGAGAGVAKIATLEAQMTSLQKMVDDLRAGDKQTREALKQGFFHDELQKMIDNMRAGDGTLKALKQGLSHLEMCADGSALEEQMTSLQKIVDEMRAGDGTLEALKQGILNRRTITGVEHW